MEKDTFPVDLCRLGTKAKECSFGWVFLACLDGAEYPSLETQKTDLLFFD